jgi:hypothetical protein
MGFGRSRSPAPAPKPEPAPTPASEPVAERVDRRAEQDAAALRARNRRGGMRSLLSTQREEAQTGLSNKLSGQ